MQIPNASVMSCTAYSMGQPACLEHFPSYLYMYHIRCLHVPASVPRPTFKRSALYSAVMFRSCFLGIVFFGVLPFRLRVCVIYSCAFHRAPVVVTQSVLIFYCTYQLRVTSGSQFDHIDSSQLYSRAEMIPVLRCTSTPSTELFSPHQHCALSPRVITIVLIN